MNILANIAHPKQLDIISVFQHLGINVAIINNTMSLYSNLEKIKPNYLFLDDKTIIERQSLLQKYNLPIISYGMVPDNIAKTTNVRCLLADNIQTNIPTISIVNYGNVITYMKKPAEYSLECDVFFVLQSPLYKLSVEHLLITTPYRIKCFSGNVPLCSASIGRLDIPQLMSLCSSAKVVLSEDPQLVSVLILYDIAAIEIKTVQLDKIDDMINDKKLRLKYIEDNKLHVRTIFDVAKEIFFTIGLTDLAEKSLQQKQKFI